MSDAEIARFIFRVAIVRLECREVANVWNLKKGKILALSVSTRLVIQGRLVGEL